MLHSTAEGTHDAPHLAHPHTLTLLHFKHTYTPTLTAEEGTSEGDDAEKESNERTQREMAQGTIFPLLHPVLS